MRLAFTIEQIEQEAEVCADRFADRRVSHMLTAVAAFLRACGVGVIAGGTLRIGDVVMHVGDAARVLHIHRQTIHAGINAGQITAHRTAENSHPLVSLHEVREWVQRKRAGARH